MIRTCRTCNRPNPPEAVFCYHDGVALGGHARNGGPVAVGTQLFSNAFVFPSGRQCRNFDELAMACQEHWDQARDLLGQGYLERFFGNLGRTDLAMAAREATRFPDRDRGLDQFLAKLPSGQLQAPALGVEPMEINLGSLRVGQDTQFRVKLKNQGMRLLYGTVICEETPWLALGDGPGAHQRLFQCHDGFELVVRVVGKRLRASAKPLEGRLAVESNGGSTVVTVRAQVAARPFPDGPLAGALSPRQIAEKARLAPREAAACFENGAVARWYKDNGWAYPVQGPTASGIGAVQQFFEALGVAQAPRVDISDRAITFQGNAGERLEHLLKVETQEKKPVFAYGTADQPWLKVGPARLDGRVAAVPVVAEVPNQPGERLMGRVAVTANGNQRFWVAVTLQVGGARSAARPVPAAPIAAAVPAAAAAMAVPVAVEPVEPDLPVLELAPAAPKPRSAPPVAVAVASMQAPLPPAGVAAAVPAVPIDAPAARPVRGTGSMPFWAHLIPVGVLLLVLLGVVGRDLILSPPGGGNTRNEDDGPLDNNPRIEARFQDGFKDDQDKNNNNLTTMRFGLVMLGVKDPKDPKRLKRLTYDEWGRTNSTVVRVENQDWLFGFGPGRWVEREGKLDKGPDGAERKGMRSVWTTDPANVKVRVTQTVELVRGDSTNLLDTCRVRYLIENFEDQGGPSRTVGLRMVLDTFIGANDGVPFVIPGEKGLCDTQKEFQGDRVPDFIQAQENDRLDDPGTVAQVQFRIGGQVEPPARVTLGAWPDPQLSFPGRPQPWLAQWDVPVLPIREKARQLAGRLQPGEIVPPDSAVVMYWPEKPIKPGEKREVGFSYGLGKVSSDKEGRLALTVGGRLVVGGEFTLTALVSNPERGEKLTLTLPPGLKLVDGTEVQDVPPPALDAQRKTSPVTWRIKAEGEGAYELKVKSSANRQQSQKVRIKQERIF